MSDVGDSATVNLIVADYAAVDAARKLNVIGGGATLLGFDPAQGVTSPFAVAVDIFVPPRHYNAEFSFELALLDEVGELVELPGPAGPQKMRVGQAMKAAEPQFPPNVHIPRGWLPAKVQFVINLANGLPLAAGRGYRWQVRIDGESRPGWSYELFVPGPPPGPVIG